MMKSIVLCADDYGQAPAISDGILSLLLKKRLSAVSCLVNSSFWREAGAALIHTEAPVDIGLHFNLTEGVALSASYQSQYGHEFAPLTAQLRRSLLRRWNREVIVAEFEAQLDAFQAVTGQVPRFIDGHQHVHQFAIIRDAILSVYEKRLRQKKVYFRVAAPALRSLKDFKQLIILLSGAASFRRQLRRLDIPHNASFSGSYSFNDLGHYREHFLTFLNEIESGGLIMCHPGLNHPRESGHLPKDPIAKARFEEYLYLASDQFLEDLTVRGVKIGQFMPRVTV